MELFPVTAQSDPPMLALITPLTNGEAGILGTGQIVAYNADGTQSLIFQLPPLDASQNEQLRGATVSRDRQWVAYQTSSDTSNGIKLVYQRIGGQATPVANALLGTFTPDSRYLLYYSVSGIDFFGVSIVNLATGLTLDLLGLITPEQGLKYGAVYPLHFDGRYLYGTTFLASVRSGLLGLYRFDLLPYLPVLNVPDQLPRHSLPVGVPVVTVGSYESMVLSPDGRKLALLYHDPVNCPSTSNRGPFTPSNTLALIDLPTRTLVRLAQAGPGQILRSPSWAADSGGIAFAGGTLPNISGIYAVSVPAGQVRQLGTLPSGGVTDFLAPLPGGSTSIAVCGSRLYYGWQRPSSAEIRLVRSQTSNLNGYADIGGAKGTVLLSCGA
ncbi:MAG: hypothetical protein U0528_01040 [Anaerolineae bacterium]